MHEVATELWAIGIVGLIAFILIIANLCADLKRRKILSAIRRKP